MIPCLTVRQPWATALVHDGLPKTIETRSRRLPTKYLGVDVGIIAGLNVEAVGIEIDGWWSSMSNARRVTMSDPSPNRFGDPTVRIELPLGAIVGTVRFVACLPIVWVDDWALGDDRSVWVEYASGTPTDLTIGPPNVDITPDLPWGDYQPGRWAWITDPTHTHRFDVPIPARGALHWQHLEVPT